MLLSDMVLAWDPAFRAVLEEYAVDERIFASYCSPKPGARPGPFVDRYEFVKRLVIQVSSGLSSPAGGRVPLRMPTAIAAYSSWMPIPVPRVLAQPVAGERASARGERPETNQRKRNEEGPTKGH